MKPLKVSQCCWFYKQLLSILRLNREKYTWTPNRPNRWMKWFTRPESFINFGLPWCVRLFSFFRFLLHSWIDPSYSLWCLKESFFIFVLRGHWISLCKFGSLFYQKLLFKIMRQQIERLGIMPKLTLLLSSLDFKSFVLP